MADKKIEIDSPKERKHALLGASSAARWLYCTPSARLCESIPEEASDYANEGTLAHEIGELKIRKRLVDAGMTDKTFKAQLNKLRKHKLYAKEMEHFTDYYADYIEEVSCRFPTKPYIVVEKRVDYSKYAPEGFGTCDCIIIGGGTLMVNDYKYGKGIAVDAEGNPQMGLYALGALEEYGFLFPVEKIVMTIIQPRLDHISSWETTPDELRDWGEKFVRPRAELAFTGSGEFKQGPWCDKGFCHASGSCRARMKENLAIESCMDPITGRLPEPPLITPEEAGDILSRARYLKKWATKLESFVQKSLLDGQDVPGWKLVEGRSNRTFTNQEAAYKVLIQAGHKKALLYEQCPICLTAAEKLVGKQDFAELLKDYIIKPPGAPTLVPADDKRPEYQMRPTAAEAFGQTPE